MQIIKGKYNQAKVFTDNAEQSALEQIKTLCNQKFVEGSKIRIMPDTHAGAGCTIGTTMTISDKIVPNLVGVDIGCGMLTIKLGRKDLNLREIDLYINKNIPSGFNINQQAQTNYKDEINKLRCFREIPKSAKIFNRALGSLGGGNHFIEIAKDKEAKNYLVVHSGSRNLGLQVARYYQKRAVDFHSGLNYDFEKEKRKLITSYKKAGKRKKIQKALKRLIKQHKHKTKLPKALCYLEGRLMQNYLHDMKIMQEYANLNRRVIGKRIVEECLNLNFKNLEKFQTIHNYIDLENNILRKGAISADKNEKVLIPLNMRDGSLICIGKGSREWNNSAPHGAGRIMSRSEAKRKINLDDFIQEMHKIYSTSVQKSTLDEAPMAYKPMREILNNISETVEVLERIIPIYNFKAK